ncbi:MAG: hypothetical protein WCK86_01650 [Planctomycetia bacterium]
MKNNRSQMATIATIATKAISNRNNPAFSIEQPPAHRSNMNPETNQASRNALPLQAFVDADFQQVR